MDIKKVMTATKIVKVLRILFIAYFLFILLTLGLKILGGIDPLNEEMIGADLALVDYAMNIFMWILTVVALYGLIKKEMWAYKLILAYFILAAIGEFLSLGFAYTNLDKMQELTGKIAVQRGRPGTTISKEFMMAALVIVAVIKVVVYMLFLGVGYWLDKKVSKGEQETDEAKRSPITVKLD